MLLYIILVNYTYELKKLWLILDVISRCYDYKNGFYTVISYIVKKYSHVLVENIKLVLE